MTRAAARAFSPGFRLSLADVGILLAGGFAAIVLGRVNLWIGVAAAFVIGHFFLFCNVLRMSRLPELVWAGTFAAMAVAAVMWRAVPWPVVLGVSGGLTLVLGVMELRRASYHGVGWRWLNPQLPEWWSARADGEAERSVSMDWPESG